jgi:hypothetical protein
VFQILNISTGRNSRPDTALSARRSTKKSGVAIRNSYIMDGRAGDVM